MSKRGYEEIDPVAQTARQVFDMILGRPHPTQMDENVLPFANAYEKWALYRKARMTSKHSATELGRTIGVQQAKIGGTFIPITTELIQLIDETARAGGPVLSYYISADEIDPARWNIPVPLSVSRMLNDVVPSWPDGELLRLQMPPHGGQDSPVIIDFEKIDGVWAIYDAKSLQTKWNLSV